MYLLDSFCSGHRSEKIYAIDCGEEAAAWISRYILEKDFGLRLGYNDGTHRRDITNTHVPLLRLYPNLSNKAIVINTIYKNIQIIFSFAL